MRATNPPTAFTYTFHKWDLPGKFLSHRQVPSIRPVFHRPSRPDAPNSYLTNMKHPAVTAHLAEPGKHKSFRDVLPNHGGHFAHNLMTRQTLIRDACTMHHSVSAKQRLFTSPLHSNEHSFTENWKKYWQQNCIWIEKVWPLLQRTLFPISLSWHNTGVENGIDLPINWIKFPANKDNWTDWRLLEIILLRYPTVLLKKKKKVWFFYYFNMKHIYVQVTENYWQLICLRDFWVLHGLKLITTLHCIYATPKHKMPKETYRTKKQLFPLTALSF